MRIITFSLCLTLAAHADCESSNLKDLVTLSDKFKQRETVPLKPEYPWIQVSKQDKDFFNWHGRLPASGELERLPND